MTAHPVPPAVPAAVIAGFEIDPGTLEFVAAGHINRTWMATCVDGRRAVLQRVNPIFPPPVNLDIDAATRHLEARGLLTPRIIPARDGRLWLDVDGNVWRLQTRIEGVAHEHVHSAGHAAEAGRLLGAFHSALADFDREPESRRLGIHDVDRHIAGLREAIEAHGRHRALDEVRALAERIFALARDLPALPASAPRTVHGDPKISNLLFDPRTGRGLCLIDLDTLNRMQVTLELGDALRSWCNAGAEDSPRSGISIERFRAAVEGYASAAGDGLTADEWRTLPDATLTIATGLAARFCADALAESYFGWDRTRFDSASAHNLARAGAQLALGQSLAGARDELIEIVETAAGRR